MKDEDLHIDKKSMTSHCNVTIDTSRFFENPYSNEVVKLPRDECLTHAQRLLRRSQLHYSTATASSSSSSDPNHHRIEGMRQFGSLYNGALGAFVFIPWKLAACHRKHGNKAESEELLKDALHYADTAVASLTSRSYRRLTLLTSPWVGAKVLQIAIWKDLGQHDKATAEAKSLATQLVASCQRLPPSACDVLYGRAGALQAILFLRQTLGNAELGQAGAMQLARDIWDEGRRHAAQQQQLQQQERQNENSTRLPVLWEWHETQYLGAAHGVVGILHTLLCLSSTELTRLDEHYGIHRVIRATLEGLERNYCWPSGNLDSSTKASHRVDRLVHWCHGATGHILLLMKAHEIYGDESYPRLACKLANEVVWERGLLKKGVGLCHGISGSSYALLAAGRQESAIQPRAHAFARFALEHLDQLEGIPDQPYCLFNGVPGLVALLLDLADEGHDDVRFPLYDYYPSYKS